MQELLMAGRKANNGSYYIHIGDLKWWLYYPPLEGDFWGHIHLWDDPAQPGRLSGLGINLAGLGGNRFIHPTRIQGQLTCSGDVHWAEKKAMKIARQNGKPTIYVLWVLQ